MPFDGNYPLIQENRRRLLEALRSLPEDFEWDFGSCDHCALGLMRRLGVTEYASCTSASAALEIPHPDALELFAGLRTYNCIAIENVTPNMVADALERVFAAPEDQR